MKTTNPNVFGFNLSRYPGLGQRFRDKCFHKNMNMIDVMADIMQKWIDEKEPKKEFVDLFEIK
jgi:hypothetical protein